MTIRDTTFGFDIAAVSSLDRNKTDAATTIFSTPDDSQ